MKNDFFTVSPPSLNFYHRFLRILLGVAMLLLSLYLAITTPFILFFFYVLNFGDSPKYGPANPTIEDYLLLNIGAVIAIGAIISVVAAVKIIFSDCSRPKSFYATLGVILNILALIPVGSFMSLGDSIGIQVITALLGATLYTGSAMAIILLTRKQKSITPANSSSHLLK